MGFSGLTSSLNTFIGVFNGGYSRLYPYAMALLGTLLVINVVLTGLYTALGKNNAGTLVERLLSIGAWVYIAKEFPMLAKAFRDSLIDAGLIAGGRGAGEHTLLTDPGRIAKLGFELTAPIMAAAENASILSGGDLIFYLFCYAALMVCFLVMSLQVYFAVLEFYLRVTVSCILLPFGVFGPTRFLAEKPIGAIVSSSIKLMVLAFILAVGEPLLAQHIRMTSDDPGFAGLWAALLSTGGMLILTCLGPGIATGFMNGSPALSAGGVAQAAASGAGIAATAGAAGVAATRAATKAATGLGKAAVQVAGSAAAGAKVGATAGAISGGNSGAAAGAVFGAAKGAAGAVAAAVGNAGRSAFQNGVQPMKAAFARGEERFNRRGRSSVDKERDASPVAADAAWSAAAGGYATAEARPEAPSADQPIRVGTPGYRAPAYQRDGAGIVETVGDDRKEGADALAAPTFIGSPSGGEPPPSAPPATPPSAPGSVEAQPAPVWADKTREHLLQHATNPRPHPTA